MDAKQIAHNLALVSLADLEDPRQLEAATNLTVKTLPYLRELLVQPIELAGTDSQQNLTTISEMLYTILLANSDSSLDELDESAIMDDGVASEDEEDLTHNIQMSMGANSAIAALKEVAFQQLEISADVPFKGKYLPLDDIRLLDDDDESAASPRRKQKRVDLMEPDSKTGMRRKNIIGRIESNN